MGRNDLKIAPNLEMALILLQNDDREFLPSKPSADVEPPDLSIFDSPVHEQFRETIAGNPSLSEEWNRKIIPLIGRGDLNEEEGTTLRLGTLLLQAFADPEKIPPPPRSATEFPPGLPTARTLGSALLMFLPDAAESLFALRLKDGETLDISRLAPEHPANKRFVEMLERNNPGLIPFWNINVLRTAEHMRTKWAMYAEKEKPNELNVGKIRATYSDQGQRDKMDAVLTYLVWGNAILQCLESDERPWAGGGKFLEVGRKIVLGGTGTGNLSEIPPLWFHLFAERTGARQVLGERVYRHLLNGGFKNNDRIAYTEIAQFGEIEGERKGFFTRNAYGLSQEAKSVLAETLAVIREESLFVEYTLSDRGERIDLSLYIDPIAPFVEVKAADASGTLWVLKSPFSSEDAGFFDKSIVFRREEVSLERVRHLLFLIKKSLKRNAAWRAHLEAFERRLKL